MLLFCEFTATKYVYYALYVIFQPGMVKGQLLVYICAESTPANKGNL